MRFITRAGSGNKVRFALRFSFYYSLCFRVSFVQLAVCNLCDLGTRVRTHALRENFNPTILEIRCDRRRSACRSKTN